MRVNIWSDEVLHAEQQIVTKQKDGQTYYGLCVTLGVQHDCRSSSVTFWARSLEGLDIFVDLLSATIEATLVKAANA